MKRKKYITVCLLFSFVAGVFFSCDNGGDCSITNVSYVNYAFYNGNNQAVSYVDTLSVYLRVNGADSVVVNRSLNTASLKLPVSYTQAVDTLIFRYSSLWEDTVYMAHENIAYFVSLDCGVAMYHNIEQVSSSHVLIDSIKIIDAEINYNERENIKIFFAN